VLRPETLRAAMEGVATMYYLVHSMGSGKDFEEQDLAAARQCAKAAKVQGVQRIIYLGGLGRSSRKAFRASAFAPGNRKRPARSGRAGDRISRGCCDRLG
jgi:uncharacterized protein YbjT (DUF2867 family)